MSGLIEVRNPTIHALLVACVLVGFCHEPEAFAEPMTIGVSLPLTGEAAAYGQDTRRAIMFAADRFGLKDIKFIFEDDQCSGKGGVTVAHKFTSVDKVRAVLGPVCSGAMLAAAPIYNQAKTFAFGIATSAPAISDAGDYIFRISPNDRVAAALLAKHVLRGVTERVGVFSEETEYCEAFRMEFEQQLRSQSKSAVAESFKTGETDFRSSLLRLKNDGVTGLFLNTQSEKTFTLVMKQMAQIGWSPKIFGAYWPSSAALLKELGSQSEGIEFVDLPGVKQFLTDEGQSVYSEFIKEQGIPQSNPVIGPLAIEAVRLIGELSTSPDWEEKLSSEAFKGSWGQYKFDSKGDVSGIPLVLNRIRNGSIEVIPGG